MPKKPAVALLRSPVRYDAVLKSLELVQDDISKKLAGSMRIVIKPDFFFTKRGVSTSVDAFRAVLDFLLEFTNKKITVAEGLYTGGNVQKVFHAAGLHELHEDYGINFVDLNKDDFVTMRLADNLSVRVAKTVLNSDFRVSLALPKLVGSNYYCAVANLAVGSVIASGKAATRNDKIRLLSSRRRDAAIAEVLKVVRPSLAVIDGFESAIGRGCIETNLCIASSDAVAADVVAEAALEKELGKKFGKQKYLDACSKAGLGQASLSKIAVTGEKL